MSRTQTRITLTALLLSTLVFAQVPDSDSTWRDYIDWAKSFQGSPSQLDAYRSKLIASGCTAAEADERIALIPKLYHANPKYKEQMDALAFNRLYRSSSQTRFTTEPNTFLVSTIKDLKPGKALDVAMGQGRNALYLASKGWEVTGFDIAEEGLKVSAENATRAGVHIDTVKARFDDFDYGKDRWDLIYFVYTDAPIVDEKYVERIRTALKPGGLVLIDRPFRSLTNPEPGWTETAQDKVNALAKAWSGLQLVFYEDTTGFGDWQQTSADRLQYKLRIVRLLGRKL